MDAITGKTGMEIVSWLGWPLHWTRDKAVTAWDRYIYLVGLRQENDQLKAEVADLYLQMTRLHEDAAEVTRLRSLHSFSAPETWDIEGARVISKKFGPHAVVDSLLVDKGTARGVTTNTPVITPQGVVGRVLRSSPGISQVLMVYDPNSRIAVVSRNHRTQGILVGQGPDNYLHMQYVPLNDDLEEGEVLITSGMDGVFPKGLPVAEIRKIARSSVSLFQTVQATPLVDLRNLEEVLLITNFSQLAAE